MTTTPDQERAAIVAWLRKRGDSILQALRDKPRQFDPSGQYEIAVDFTEFAVPYFYTHALAEAIARGDHKGE